MATGICLTLTWKIEIGTRNNKPKMGIGLEFGQNIGWEVGCVPGAQHNVL